MIATVVILGDTCDDFNTKDYTDFSAELKATSWGQGDQAYDLRTEYGYKGNEYHQHYTPLLNYSGGAYELVIDLTVETLPFNQRTLAWRGLCCAACRSFCSCCIYRLTLPLFSLRLFSFRSCAAF